MDNFHCSDLFKYNRFKTSIVNIGDIPMGGDYPIRIQSMTNRPTLDTRSSVEQCIKIIDAGADYVRITTPGTQDAENLRNIKEALRKKGYKNPLIADVHFNPKVAELAATIVEKVRINPGNYADKKQFKQIDYTDTEYKNELERIRERLLPLLNICKQNGTAIRIGVNHGSLSDRIMSRYGDTPNGMVEAAMEFIRICVDENFKNLVISLKASNTRIMVQAYRTIIKQMTLENMNFPLHIGVTEAGDSEDGRIKSAVGIGALLADGIGDTIRVSLSEEPELEIPVAQSLASHFSNRSESHSIIAPERILYNPFSYEKRETLQVDIAGGSQVPVVIADYPEKGYHSLNLPDYFYIKPGTLINDLPKNHNYIINMKEWFLSGKPKGIHPLYTDAEFSYYGEKSEELNFVIIENRDINPSLIEQLKEAKKTILICETYNKNGFAEQRSLFLRLKEYHIKLPVIINRNYNEDDSETLQVKAASDIGSLFIDGLGDGIWLRNVGGISSEKLIEYSFSILQAARVRTTKTEYISCPSCGRTQFDLQSTIAQIKSRTSHLKHLKIGIMGCIVNGPGEMADADYGYVGAGVGKVTLYKGKEVIKKNIDSKLAVEELINVIKEFGDWKDA